MSLRTASRLSDRRVSSFGENAPVCEAARLCGGYTSLARISGCTLPNLSRYARGITVVPVCAAEQIANATGGRVQAADIIEANRLVRAAQLVTRAEAILAGLQ